MLHSRSIKFRRVHYTSLAWLLCLAVLLPAASHAVDGALDTSFGTAGTGLVLTDFSGSGSNDSAEAVAIQSNGKVIVAGQSDASGNNDFALARYNVDGTLDTSFGSAGTGLVLTDFSGRGSYDVDWALALQSDGKIVLAGQSDASGSTDFALARYNADGTLDTSFGAAGTGLVLTDFSGSGSFDQARALAIQSDGKIVVAGNSSASGNSDFALARYNADGTLDTSFGNAGTGLVLTDFSGSGSGDGANALAIQSDGKIVAAGGSDASGSSDFAVARYNADRTLDTTYGNAGTALVLTDFSGSGSDDVAGALVIQSDGKILAAGFSNASGSYDFALARYNADGTLDTSFGNAGNGLVLTDFGGVTDSASGLAIQTDGKIVAAGISRANLSSQPDFALARYNVDGTLDTSFGNAGTGLVLTDFSGSGSDDRAFALSIQSDGKILAAGLSNASGSYDFALARYTNSIPVTAIPTLDDSGLALLMLLLAAAALFATGRAARVKGHAG